MTFGVSRDQGLFEWSGTSLSAVFAQKSNFFKPRMWQMIFDIVRFNQFALDLLSEEDESEIDISGANGSAKHVGKPARQQSIGEYLDQEGYSDAFRNDYLIPMTASVWSTSPDKASLEFPAITLIRFMWNHHLLTTVAARPTWMTITGGSRQYIDAVMRDFPEDHVHLDTGIQSLSIIENDRLAVDRMDGKRDVFDHVILATHGDQAMEIIRDMATPQEIEIMSGFKTSKNTAVLHSDRSVSIKLTSLLVDGTLTSEAHAKAIRCLVLLELYHYFSISQHHSVGLLDLLDEPSSAHPLTLWYGPCDSQSSSSAQSCTG